MIRQAKARQDTLLYPGGLDVVAAVAPRVLCTARVLDMDRVWTDRVQKGEGCRTGKLDTHGDVW